MDAPPDGPAPAQPPPPPPSGATPSATNPHAGQPYGTAPYTTVPYGTVPYGTAPYGSPPYGTAPHGSPSYGANPYAHHPYGTPHPSLPYGTLPERGSGQGNVLVVRLLGLGIALLLVGAGAFAMVTMFFRQSAQESSTYAGPVTQVIAETDTGDVSVHEGDAGQPLTIRRTLNWSFHRPTVDIGTTAGTVVATARCRTPANGVTVGDCSVDLDITVPRGTAVRISTRTGDVRADGVTGTVDASANTGNVDLRGLRSSRVTAVSNTGDVTVVLLADPQDVQARTSTGDVRVVVPADGTAYRVSLHGSVGQRTIQLPTDPAAARTITASTSVGDLTLTSS